ncbi:MAG: MOSC domain-containing protein [Acidimicrobiia bacterium]|jgi:uncharacterized protein
MEPVGTVAQLWRYPVKSFQGEQVERLELDAGGAQGDRTLAVVDPAARKVLSAKRWPDLLHAAARLHGDDVVLTLPDGREHLASDPSVHSALSTWLDHEVRLEAPPVETVYPMEMHTGMSDEDTPVFDWSGPPGTWLDLADAHWLTTAGLRAIAREHPQGQWDVRRFRPTALIDVEGEGFPEDGWNEVELGPVRSTVLMPTPRCSMPSRAQPGLERDKAIGTTIRDRHHNNLGIYGTITTAGAVAVGDVVRAR